MLVWMPKFTVIVHALLCVCGLRCDESVSVFCVEWHVGRLHIDNSSNPKALLGEELLYKGAPAAIKAGF